MCPGWGLCLYAVAAQSGLVKGEPMGERFCYHLAGEPWWDAEATAPGKRDRTEGLVLKRGCGGRVRDQSLSPLTWRCEVGVLV